MNTFADTELMLRTAISISENSIKDIASGANIKANTLYKWKSNNKVHLSPSKADSLLLYFENEEPHTLLVAELLIIVYLNLYNYLSSSTDEEVTEEDENYDRLC